jgi:predicted DCC family thiol-disulfide oxidoreductase YuxK
MAVAGQNKPMLLFNDECAVCRRIADWVQKSAQRKSGGPSIMERPIGEDPQELRALNPALDIWDAYATVHVLMPDGSMKLGGEAVAEVLRNLPNTKWFAWSFAIGAFGFRPFQMMLNMAYAILADVRPLLGCESCGTSNYWVRSISGSINWAKSVFGKYRHPNQAPRSTAFLATEPRPLAAFGRGPR